MNTEEIVREAVKGILSEEKLEEIARGTISEMVYENMRYTFEKTVTQVAREVIEEKGESILEEILKDIMNKPVRIDNGWGDIQEKGSFEDFVRSTLRSRCCNEWDVERKLRNMVDERLKKIAHEVVGRHVEEDLCGEVMEELVKQID